MSTAVMITALLTAAFGCEFTAPDAIPPPCGGVEATACPWGHACEDDPDDDCDPAAGYPCPGVCTATQCGGILGTVCSQGQVCVDDPRDSCDPKHGGADCIGLCQEDHIGTVGCDEGDRTFVSHEQDLCDQIQFLCEAGWIQFFDHCGCGCMLEGA